MRDGGKSRGEFALIADLFAPLSRGSAGALGLLDDAALIDIPPGHQLVATADTLIAGVHFRADDPPDLIARKSLRVNLSDLAAMGATPVGFLQALALNDTITDSFLEKYSEGLKADIDAYALPLLGGDTTSGPGPLTITIVALGSVERGKALLRSGAKENDLLCVTGTLGDGALGLACLEGQLRLPDDQQRDAIDRYRLPRPRLSLGQRLCGLATACADISDGLVADIEHICNASAVAAEIEQIKLPLSSGARSAVTQDQRWWTKILSGGDDYELVFTVPESKLAQVTKEAESCGTAVTVIGRIQASKSDRVGAVVLDPAGHEIKITDPGFRHR